MTPETATDRAKAVMDWLQSANVMAADCPSRQILGHVASRWGTLVLMALQTGTHRFSALRRMIGGVSERMLAQTLQNLEADGLVRRVARDVVPPHVEYSLTPFGAQAAVHVAGLVAFIEGNLAGLLADRPTS